MAHSELCSGVHPIFYLFNVAFFGIILHPHPIHSNAVFRQVDASKKTGSHLKRPPI